jgi:chemotaxis protein CheD
MYKIDENRDLCTLPDKKNTVSSRQDNLFGAKNRNNSEVDIVRHTIGVAAMKVTANKNDLLVTHALGSCLGITIHDPVNYVGGLLHVMLPLSSIDQAKAKENPYMFVDTGVPKLFHKCYEAGADRSNLIVKVAGGAAFRDQNDLFAIGKRNFIILRKLFWKNGFIISGEDIGGNISRTLFFEIATGRTWIRSGGKEWDL